MRTQSIGLVWIVVKDFKSAVKFYTEVAGLKVAEINEEWAWAELEGHEGPGMRLGIAQESPQSECPNRPGQNGVVTFSVEDIEKARQDLVKQGANLEGPIQEVPGHIKMQSVRDNDGNLFQLVQLLETPCHTIDQQKKSCCSH